MKGQMLEKNVDYIIKNRKPETIRPFEYTGKASNIPKTLLYLWSRIGLATWCDGAFRTCDPDVVFESIEYALENKKIIRASDCLPYGISAFGVVYVWNKNVGAIDFDFQKGRIIMPNIPGKIKSLPSEAQILSSIPNNIDGIDAFDLFRAAVDKLGNLEENQIFSFSPALVLGGKPSLDSLIVVSVREHLAFLGQSQEFEIYHFDSRLCDGGYELIE